MAEPHLWARPLTPEFSSDFFALQDRLAATECGGCYCIYWHFAGDNEAWHQASPAQNREAKARRIAESGDTGMLLYEDQTPIGWLQFGPRKHFPKLLQRVQPPPGPEELWSINCFLMDPAKRRQGNARALLAIGLEHLARLGVKEVEGYPKSGSLEDGEAWTGPLQLFLDAGFKTVQDKPSLVVRKSL